MGKLKVSATSGQVEIIPLLGEFSLSDNGVITDDRILITIFGVAIITPTQPSAGVKLIANGFGI